MNEFDEIREVLKIVGERQDAITIQQERTQRHLDVLIQVVDGLIRDRRFKDLEERVLALETK